jgi:hypothetical protein
MKSRAISATLPLVMSFLLSSISYAACSGTSVNSFGARGDGVTDDTGAIQSAINSVASAGGGSVVFSVARYKTTGTFNVPTGVVLCGAIEGPFDVVSTNPANATVAPTLLITNTVNPFITLSGLGSGVTDLLFHYPNQVTTSASAPTPFPYTIRVTQAGAKVARCTVTNAYQFLDVQAGRTTYKDLFIGAYSVGINVDHVADHTTFQNIFHQVFWDVLEGAAYPTNIDNWVLNNGYAMIISRADSIEISNFALFSRYSGFLLKDSDDTTQNFACAPSHGGYGTISNVDLDSTQYAIIASSSCGVGYKFANIDFGPATLGGQSIGKAAVFFQSGGSTPPYVLINGGSIRGSWASTPFRQNSVPGSKLSVVNVIGWNF